MPNCYFAGFTHYTIVCTMCISLKVIGQLRLLTESVLQVPIDIMENTCSKMKRAQEYYFLAELTICYYQVKMLLKNLNFTNHNCNDQLLKLTRCLFSNSVLYKPASSKFRLQCGYTVINQSNSDDLYTVPLTG